MGGCMNSPSGFIPSVTSSVQEMVAEILMHRSGLTQACELPIIALALMSLDYEAAVVKRMNMEGEDKQAALEFIWDYKLSGLEQKKYNKRAKAVQAVVLLLTNETV